MFQEIKSKIKRTKLRDNKKSKNSFNLSSEPNFKSSIPLNNSNYVTSLYLFVKQAKSSLNLLNIKQNYK